MPFNKNCADVLFLRGEYEKAAEMYLDGARDGNEDAAFNYAYCLWHGLGTERDVSGAKSFFSFARDLAGGDSCYNLAVIYMEGEGVARDYYQAYRYMTDAAELGSVEAMLYLGMSYTVGYLLYPEITSVSRIPFHKPQIRTENIYMLEGRTEDDIAADEEARSSVIRTDPRRAFEYFSAAAHADSTYVEDLVAKGKFLYARCFIDGFGTEFNRDTGVRLMLAAGRSGSEDAAAFLAEVGVSTLMLEDAKKKKSPR